MYLLDTNIVSETIRPVPDHNVAIWLLSQPTEALWISVLTIAEIERGIALAEQRDTARARQLSGWLEGLLTQYQDQIVPVDRATARIWGRMAAATTDLDIDAAIAATASAHGWTVATRNVRDFSRFGVPVFNPFPAST
ncbi:type II toxin-antitoxin system VapC family toxin [Inquilinus limosus]|uniref:Ribonuclease VapC n=1 Tax=Inquilinus limosus TaxID=171674 RepID=A0A211ZES2_9PROT|nr:type II toxin-antitoxin system VapC family toxin [Inquilinus limosus]OWJ63720.1 hypothetical protein BWR60_28435 [Inquilinus limosus]